MIHTDPLLVAAHRVVFAWHEYPVTDERLAAAIDVLEQQAFGALEALVRKQADDDED
jgi:hypothetical protein